jgi:transcriptional regulator with XRE-family HTH domain
VSALGLNIRLRRSQIGLTGKALAERIGVSPSLISKIENGKTSPSMDVLRKIVMELNVTMADLMDFTARRAEEEPYDSARPRVALVRANERKMLRLNRRGLVYQLLTPDAPCAAEFVWVEMEPGEGGSEFLSHERGEESVFVLHGALEVVVGNVAHRLEEGDCITFDATLPHLYRNEELTTTTYIYSVVPPTL